jgi:hypothetical protein
MFTLNNVKNKRFEYLRPIIGIFPFMKKPFKRSLLMRKKGRAGGRMAKFPYPLVWYNFPKINKGF